MKIDFTLLAKTTPNVGKSYLSSIKFAFSETTFLAKFDFHETNMALLLNLVLIHPVHVRDILDVLNI